MAFRLAKRTGNTQVTAMPLGLVLYTLVAQIRLPKDFPGALPVMLVALSFTDASREARPKPAH